MFALHFGGYLAVGLFGAGAVGATNSEGVWFVTTGVALILWGLAMHAYVRDTGRPVPRVNGVLLAVLCVFLLVLVPVSGVWLLILQVPVLLGRPGWKRAQRDGAGA
jgi:hypothetical protein